MRLEDLDYRLDEKNERNEESPPDAPCADSAIYRGVLGDLAHTAEPTTEADPVGIHCSLLSGTGVLIGPGPHVRIGNIRHPLLIWTLLLGRTGSGRKGEATAISELFMRQARPEFGDLTVGGLSSGEGLIERIRDGVRDDKRLLVIEPEFTAVMARSRREGSTLATVQRQAWEGRALSVLNRKEFGASSSHVAVIGHVAPREFRLRLAETDMAGGTYNRYLPVYVERAKLLPIPEGLHEQLIAAQAGKLAAAIGRAAKVGAVQLGRDATDLWTGELYPEFAGADDDDDRAYSEFTRRAAPYCLRIGGLYAALDGRALIGKDDLAAAGALVRYSLASARYVLGSAHRDPRMDRLTRALTAAGEAGLTLTAISALFSRNLPAAVLAELLGELLASRSYEEIQAQTGGRAATLYRRTSFV